MTSDDRKRYYRKKTDLFLLLDKIKLWPSSKGILHGIQNMEINGDYAIITTYCGKTFRVRNSRNSRAARWLRNKWAITSCPDCNIPQWKIGKYSATRFSEYGSDLKHDDN